MKKGRYWDSYMEAFRNDTIKDAAEQYCEKKADFIKKQDFLYRMPYSWYKFYRFILKKN